MRQQIELTLDGKTYRGLVTDMDALFISGFMLENFERVLEDESGLMREFQAFTTKNKDILAGISDPEESVAARERLYDEWGERLLIRLQYNIGLRSAFIQRLCDVFPNVDPKMLKFDRWTDKEGNIHDDGGRMRLDLDECMSVVTRMSEVVKESFQEKQATAVEQLPASTPAKKSKSAKGFSNPPQPAVESPDADRIRQQIADLQAQLVED